MAERVWAVQVSREEPGSIVWCLSHSPDLIPRPVEPLKSGELRSGSGFCVWGQLSSQRVSWRGQDDGQGDLLRA